MRTGVKKQTTAGQWWRTPLIPALRRQRQEDLCEFEVYKREFQDRLQSYTEKPCLEKQQ